ncbi:hypothetical protein K493DRAFT_310504 [Basidiobolus meristosporus CBS 931.73]|uniref:GOST seven transmembrane domain-containing protein n=1 Tax=Basidiobolus meristosporus CBS 931.73 TaxID=1314790 RepID=A0A1Y1Z8M1_9FUNG|nr:hypothetical protein K493DRAFT_310504 [Basidiobolus meristosporus CBS 931.73]|eukprot:ORY06556.1 hypothetical protein K493DRAFT_310504 [Basidiobolus meristosporus CBS 931.73]
MPSRVLLSDSREQNMLAQFAFGRGGQGRVSIGNLTGIPDNYTDRHFFRFAVVEDTYWSNLESLAATTQKSYCDIDRLYWGENAIYRSFDYAQLQGPFNASQSTESFVIHRTGTYYMLFLNCGNFEVEFLLYASFFNMVNGRITHLPVGSIPLPTVYMIFGLGVWPAFALPWVYNWYRQRQQRVNLHWLYSLYPMLQIALCLYCALAYNFISKTGETPEWLQVFRGSLWFISSCSYYLFRLYVSKGYGISRTKLASQEKRVVFGVAVFAAAMEATQQIIGGASVIGVIIFYFITYFYLFWNSRAHFRLLGSYIGKLREKSSTELLVKAYTRKYKLILQTCRIAICFGFVSLLIQVVDYLALTLTVRYIHHITIQGIRAIEFLVMGYFFLLRPADSHITISSHSLRRRALLERQPTSQQRQAAPSINLGSQELDEAPEPANRYTTSPGLASSRPTIRFRNWNWLRRS